MRAAPAWSRGSPPRNGRAWRSRADRIGAARDGTVARRSMCRPPTAWKAW
jgi:hypothetical protein